MLKKIALIGSLFLGFQLVFVAPSSAGNYDVRRNELLSGLDTLALEPRVANPIRTKLVAYFEFRERALAEALVLLQDPSTSNQEQRARWREHFARTGAESTRLIYSALQDALPGSALNFLTTHANIEADFYGKLARMPLASARDRIIVYRESFDAASRSLAEKWRTLDSSDNSIDAAARSAQQQFRELYTSTADAVAAANSSTERWVISLIELANTLPDSPALVGPVIEFLRQLESMDTRSAAIADRIRDLHSSEERVILVFNDTRKDVRDFLSKMNLALLTSQMNDHLMASEGIAGQTLTGGQRSDALAFYQQATLMVRVHFDSFEDQFEKFVAEFDSIFFNALGDKTIENLLETQSWREWSDGMRGIQLEQALKSIYERADRNFGVDLSRIQDPTQRARAEKWLRRNMEALREKVGKTQGWSVSDRLQTVIYMGLPESLRNRLLRRLRDG
jgi:hypothetical protein